MPKQVQLRRGTTAEHATFVGAAGEVTVDTSRKCVVVHDGVTPGGVPMAGAAVCVLLDPGADGAVQNVKSCLRVSGGSTVEDTALRVDHAATIQGTLSARRVETLSLALLGTCATYAATVTLNFGAASFERIVLGGDLTLATANLGVGGLFKVVIVADGNTRSLHFPGWTWVGGSAPATIGANKAGLLELVSGGWGDNDVLARWTVQP
jgi:hypothetical protein